MSEPHTCQCCGQLYTRYLLPEAYVGNNCHDCSFWLTKTDYPEFMASRQVIINGVHYMAYAETESIIRGGGGRRVVIQFYDDRIITTNNLWSQGRISARFRPMLRDNAFFIAIGKVPVQPVEENIIPE